MKGQFAIGGVAGVLAVIALIVFVFSQVRLPAKQASSPAKVEQTFLSQQKALNDNVGVIPIVSGSEQKSAELTVSTDDYYVTYLAGFDYYDLVLTKGLAVEAAAEQDLLNKLGGDKVALCRLNFRVIWFPGIGADSKEKLDICK